MKTILSCLVFIFSVFIVNAQECSKYSKLISEADVLRKQGRFIEALNKYNSAQTYCKSKADEVQEMIVKMFEQINELKIKAERAEKRALKEKENTAIALKKAEAAESSARANLAKANKLINAFYFYDNKFALALKEEHIYTDLFVKNFYYIDKNGNAVTKLRRWYRAEQFDEDGFARVQENVAEMIEGNKETVNYLLDTLGNTYHVAYDTVESNKDVTALDLTWKGLSVFPNNILKNSQLEVLRISSGKDIYLPEQIAVLNNLKYLGLLDLGISFIPQQIGELRNLISLNLSANKISSLPPQIGELKKLTSLNLSANRLSTLPLQIGELKNLISLNLSSNKLSILPQQVGELKNLSLLDLRFNKDINWKETIASLSIIPKKVLFTINKKETIKDTCWVQIDKKTQLFQVLTLAPLSQIGELKKLTWLDFNFYELGTLAQQIGELKNLTRLDLVYNHLQALPSQIGELKNLTTLNLHANKLTTLPPQISQLKNLKEINLTSNNFSKMEKERIRKLLPPTCKISF